jgi:hypothetical protein
VFINPRPDCVTPEYWRRLTCERVVRRVRIVLAPFDRPAYPDVSFGTAVNDVPISLDGNAKAGLKSFELIAVTRKLLDISWERAARGGVHDASNPICVRVGE